MSVCDFISLLKYSTRLIAVTGDLITYILCYNSITFNYYCLELSDRG